MLQGILRGLLWGAIGAVGGALGLGLIFAIAAGFTETAGAQASCDVLTPGNSCVLPITATAATKIISVASCGSTGWIVSEADSPAADLTVMPQRCFTDASGDVDCEDLDSTALNGGTILAWSPLMPLDSVRGNATVTANCSVSGDCALVIACGR